jgi:hypothetical protein
MGKPTKRRAKTPPMSRAARGLTWRIPPRRRAVGWWSITFFEPKEDIYADDESRRKRRTSA